jgi:hypothetical protein
MPLSYFQELVMNLLEQIEQMPPIDIFVGNYTSLLDTDPRQAVAMLEQDLGTKVVSAPHDQGSSLQFANIARAANLPLLAKGVLIGNGSLGDKSDGTALRQVSRELVLALFATNTKRGVSRRPDLVILDPRAKDPVQGHMPVRRFVLREGTGPRPAAHVAGS